MMMQVSYRCEDSKPGGSGGAAVMFLCEGVTFLIYMHRNAS